jgi:hypothetical protein
MCPRGADVAQIIKEAVRAVLSGEIQERDDLVKPKEQLKEEVSTIGVIQDSAMFTEKKGGIDLDSSLMDLEIKKDGNGIALAYSKQDISSAPVDGFTPVIVRIVPVDIKDLLVAK